MTGRERLFAGILGALMPICAIVLTLDLSTIFSEESGLSTANLIGFTIQFVIFLFVGGTVAYMHSDETKAYKLFQIGMATPALLASFTTSNSLNTAISGGSTEEATNETSTPSATPVEGTFNFNLISSAFAYDEKSNLDSPAEFQLAMGGDSFFKQVIQGVTGEAVGNAKPKIKTPPKNNTNKNNTKKNTPGKTTTIAPRPAPAAVPASTATIESSSSANVIRVPEEASLEIEEVIAPSSDAPTGRNTQMSYEQLQRELRNIESLKQQIERQMRVIRPANPN